MADLTLPTITCPANVVTNNSPATACSAVVTYGSITGTDNCSAPTLTLQSGLVSGSTFPVGVTTNIWRATDASLNTRTCSFTVTVNDVTLPNITCPANIVKNNDPGVCGAITTYATPNRYGQLRYFHYFPAVGPGERILSSRSGSPQISGGQQI